MRVIKLSNIWERYRIKFVLQGRISWSEIWALEDISLSVEKGEVLGIIGQNGAGKTTLLKLMAGMLIPDKGDIELKGKISTLMELGAGFNPEFTGRENIRLNARIYGLEEEELDKKIDKIIEFAGLGKFIDAPIKYYSQGMYLRLAFALAIFVEPDIILIDDILAVGDEEAKQKCLRKIFELKHKGKTIILVTHDMDMVNRLCDRAILIQKGKIIKEGSPQRVISYYLQTVGDKDGIGILERKDLKIIFNNGRLIFNYKDYMLTKEPAGYVSYFDPRITSWFSSVNLTWSVVYLSQDKIVAEGRSDSGDVVQIWILQLLDSYLEWRVDIKEDGVREPHIDLLLIPRYSAWQTLDHKGNFPVFIHKTNWQDLGFKNKGILVLSPDAPDSLVPNIVLETADAESRIQLLNTGYEQEARVIQLPLEKKEFISNRIRISLHRDTPEEYLGRVRERMLMEQEENQRRIRKLHTISSGYFRVFADVDDKTVRLYYKDKEITGHDGLFSEFTVSNQFILSKQAQWQIQRESDNKLVLTLDYEFLSLCQIWRLILEEDSILYIEIKIKSAKPVTFITKNVILGLNGEYNSYRTFCEKGIFLGSCYINGISPVRLKDNKISEIILIADKNKQMPEFYFSSFSCRDRRIITMYKQKKEIKEELYLKSSLIIPKKEDLIEPDSQVYFAGRIILGRKMRLARPALDKAYGLSKGDLRFIFDKGRGRIFWGQRELTRGLCVYTSIRSFGIWYDSYQAVWKVRRKDNTIVALGYWPHLSISQEWYFELVRENEIYWAVDMEVYDKVEIEIEQANVMVSSRYKDWIIPDINGGRFLNDYSQDYDISPYRFWYGESKEIITIAKDLPKIIFKNETDDRKMRAIVENSEFIYKARRLQWHKVKSNSVMPGRYLYFKGVIQVDTEK
jgi:ABC-type polysaccharide/polyol phosphate transport system ATPase subunit